MQIINAIKIHLSRRVR